MVSDFQFIEIGEKSLKQISQFKRYKYLQVFLYFVSQES